MDTFTPNQDREQASGVKRKVQFCSYCGTKLDEGARFCKGCGEAVANDVQQTRSTKREEPIPEKQPERKSVYEGYIHKCPNCGDIIDAYETVCSACGYEIRGRHTTSVVHELSLKLEKTDDPQKRDDLIRTFYIPNTKEDIHEFFILALSFIKIGEENTNSWMVKLEQAYQKAELSFGGTQEFERLKPMYEQAQIMNRKNSKVSFWKNTSKYFGSGYTWALLFCVIGLFFLLVDIAFDTETLSMIGMGACVVAMWIGLMTMINNDDKKKKSANRSKNARNQSGFRVQSMGKDADEFIHEHYEDAVEQLRALGFKNIVARAEKKGLLDTEGAIKGISIAGNAEFSEDDEFDVESKIIIRYYSKNTKG